MAATSSTFRVQKDLKEIAEMSWEDAAPILATPTSDHLTNLTALIVGPPGTCYHGGFLTFSVKTSSLYPNEAPSIRCLATNEGRVRLNPNIYADGKVCLSVLGTYRGETSESWRSTYSLRYVLQCIQSMVLNEEPYHNEPGFSKQTWHKGVQLLLPANHPGAETPGIVDLGEEPQRKVGTAGGGEGSSGLVPPGAPPPTAEELVEMGLVDANKQNASGPEAGDDVQKVGLGEEVEKAEKEKAEKAAKRKVRRYLVSSTIIKEQSRLYHEKITHESLRISVCDVLECLLPNCRAPDYVPQPEETPLFLSHVVTNASIAGREDSTETPEFESPGNPIPLSVGGGGDDGSTVSSATGATLGNMNEMDEDGEEVPLDSLISNSATPAACTPVTFPSGEAGFSTLQSSASPPPPAVSTAGSGSPQQTTVFSPPPKVPMPTSVPSNPGSAQKQSPHGSAPSAKEGGQPAAPGGSPTTSPSSTAGGGASKPSHKVSSPSWQHLARKNFLECSRVELFEAEIKRQFLMRYEGYVEICSQEARLATDGSEFIRVMFEFPSNQCAGIFTWRWLLQRLQNIKLALIAETDAWKLKGRELTSKHAYAAEDLASQAIRIPDNVPCASGSLVSTDNAYHWSLGFMAPEGLYEEGFYNVEVTFCPGQDQPPRCRFLQPIYHPNISPEGYSVYFLWDRGQGSSGGKSGSGNVNGGGNWTPSQVARGILKLLTSRPLQYPAVVLNPQAAAECFSSDEAKVKEFRKKARRMARDTVE